MKLGVIAGIHEDVIQPGSRGNEAKRDSRQKACGNDGMPREAHFESTRLEREG
jgi:hypothetical protein